MRHVSRLCLFMVLYDYSPDMMIHVSNWLSFHDFIWLITWYDDTSVSTLSFMILYDLSPDMTIHVSKWLSFHDFIWLITWYDDTCVSTLSFHGFIRGVGQGEDVGRPLVDFPPFVFVHIVLVVDVHGFVRVHRDHHFTNVRIDLILTVPVMTKSL